MDSAPVSLPTSQAPERPIRWWWALLAYAIVAAFQLIIAAAAGLFVSLGVFGREPAVINAVLFSPASIAVQVVLSCSVLALVALALPRLLGQNTRAFLRLGKAPWSLIVLGVLGVLGLGFLVDEVLFLLHRAWPSAFDIAGLEIFGRVFAAAALPTFVGLTVIVTMGPGLGEELFFRGFVLRASRNALPAWAAVALSAALFGALHMNLLQGVGAGLIGAYMGFLALRTNSLWPAVAAHAVNNLASSLFARYGDQGGTAAWSEGHPWWVLLVAASFTALACLAVVRRTDCHPGS